MTTSITGGQLVFNAGTFLNRGLNLLDATDPGACRANLGLTGVLTIGNGIVASSGTYSPTTSATISVNTTTNATPSTITSYDANGNLTVASTLNLGTGATMTRASGTNGAMALTNTGSGVFSLNNGSGVIQLVTGSNFQLTAAGASPSTVMTNAGLAVGLTNGAVGTGLTVTGGLNADSLSGSAISDSTTGTSSTIAASTKAVATVSTAASAAQTTATAAQTTASAAVTSAANKLDLTTSTAQSVASVVTFAGGIAGNPTFTGGLKLNTYQKIEYATCAYTAHNGTTTSLASGAPLPATTMVEQVNDFATAGLDATGIFTAPKTGRYMYSVVLYCSPATALRLIIGGTTYMTWPITTFGTFTGTIALAGGQTAKFSSASAINLGASGDFISWQLML